MARCWLGVLVLVAAVTGAPMAAAQSQGLGGTELPARFVGSGPNDTIDQAYRLIGSPARETELSIHKKLVAEWPERIRIVFDPQSRKILIVRVSDRRGIEKLRAAGVRDRALDLIGMQRDKAIELLGPPTRADGMFLEWSLKEGRREVAQFKLICPLPSLLSSGECEEMSIVW